MTTPISQATARRPLEDLPIEILVGGDHYWKIVKYFTKWPELYAILNQEASTVADVLVSNFCRFGVPMKLHSDQGQNIESRIVWEVLERLGVRKTRTTPLHPQLDGMVEGYMKTVEEHLRKVLSSHQRDWDERLTLFLLAHRASTHETTGVMPKNMVFGRELRLPCDLMFGAPPDKEQSVTDYTADLIERLRHQPFRPPASESGQRPNEGPL